MSKAIRDDAFHAFTDAEGIELGTRIKEVRHQPQVPDGRAHATLFSRRGPGDRPHPRFSFTWPPAEDPSPPGELFDPRPVPSDVAALDEAIGDALSEHHAKLHAHDLNDADAHAGGAHWRRNSIRGQRVAGLFADVRAKVARWRREGVLAGAPGECDLIIARAEAGAFAGSIAFDDIDTGTYHSFGHDAPFVHYLEEMLGSLPEEGTEAMALLPSSTRESVRRQRRQARAHLDHLMRHKYSYDVVDEQDAERTIGAFVIDRRTRHIVSERADSDPISPRFELVRIDPNAAHEHAGAWVYRDPAGKIRRQDHTEVAVPAAALRGAPIDRDALTFRRAPKDPALRKGLRFDWDGNGYIDAQPISWVSWAGHCDVKAVLEQVGLTLSGKPSVTEYRSETGMEIIYDRDLLLEMVASAIELGSRYRRIDGTGFRSRGIHRFGGSRNDSRPDRLQMTGPGEGKSFRWPRRGRHDSFLVQSVTRKNGQTLDLATAFFRHLPDTQAVRFEDNPHFLKVTEGDYNIIDISGAKIEARVKIDTVDPNTGFLREQTRDLVLDLSDDAQPEGRRYFLGTEVVDAAERLIYEVFYEPADNRIVGELRRWEKSGEAYAPTDVPERNVELPMVSPLTCTLSREMKRDNPGQFAALLDIAMREGKNICADTDKKSEVWNGVVTAMESRRVAENRAERTERWQIDIKARFGAATLDYLVRRDGTGVPEAFCPAVGDSDDAPWPDFLWHDIPDVGSKAFEGGEWLVNDAMWERGVVDVRPDESVPSGFYVYDDHVKNVYELIFCGLAGYRYTVVHGNKRYGFRDEPAFREATRGLARLRSAVRFETG